MNSYGMCVQGEDSTCFSRKLKRRKTLRRIVFRRGVCGTINVSSQSPFSFSLQQVGSKRPFFCELNSDDQIVSSICSDLGTAT